MAKCKNLRTGFGLEEDGMTTCKDCNFQKFVAKTFDIHIDWRDCWEEDCEYKKQKGGDTE